MNCKELDLEKCLIPFLQDELSVEELELFIAHIESCPSCYEELQTSFSLYYGLKMLEEDEPQAVNLQKEFEKRIEEAKHQIHRRKRMRRIMITAAVLLLMAVFIVIGFFIS